MSCNNFIHLTVRDLKKPISSIDFGSSLIRTLVRLTRFGGSKENKKILNKVKKKGLSYLAMVDRKKPLVLSLDVLRSLRPGRKANGRKEGIKKINTFVIFVTATE